MKMNKKGRRTGITMNKKLGSTLIAMTIIIFMLFLTLGMFTKNFGGSAKAEVASAQTSIVGGDLSSVNDDGSIDTDNSGIYTFSVKNTDKDGNNASEVAMNYKLYIDTVTTDDNNNSIYDGKVSYELYKLDGNSEVKIESQDSDGWYTDDDVMKFTVETDSSKQKQVHQYKIKFTPSGEGKFKFKVKVKSQQID